jgi:hypothetical protein
MSGPLSFELHDPFLSGVIRARSVRKHETSIAFCCEQLLASSRNSSAVFSLYTACAGRAVCAPLSEQIFFSPCPLFSPSFRLVCPPYGDFARANAVRPNLAVEQTETSREVRGQRKAQASSPTMEQPAKPSFGKRIKKMFPKLQLPLLIIMAKYVIQGHGYSVPHLGLRGQCSSYKILCIWT